MPSHPDARTGELTNVNDTPTTNQDLAARMRAAVLAAATDDTDTAADLDDAQTWADEHLDGLTGAHVSDAARDLVDALLAGTAGDGGHPAPAETPDRRERLLAALDRGLAANARRDVLIQPLLAETRVAALVSRADLAARTGLTEDQVRGLESGTRPLSAETPDTVAEWIHHAGADEDAALAALERSLDQAGDGDYALAAAAGNTAARRDNTAFVATVRARLAELRPEPATTDTTAQDGR